MKTTVKIPFLLFVLLITAALLCACDALGGLGKGTTPVYRGMTISSDLEEATLSVAYGAAAIEGDDTPAPEYTGDHAGAGEDFDSTAPFPESTERIEDEIASSLSVIGAAEEIYYTTPNTDIYIHVHIDNPDNYEILSFTLNGKKYSSYMFEPGSDMQTLILKLNVGDAHGVVEYTIDAIKYVDGESIRDVKLDGDKTVKAGVRTKDQVTAEILSPRATVDTIAFTATVNDPYGLVAYFEGTLKAVLYDGEDLVAEKTLSPGENDICFEGLCPHTAYQYAVVGYYDDLSGEPFGMHVLYKDAIMTEAMLLFDRVSIGRTSISFDYLRHPDHPTLSPSTLTLYPEDGQPTPLPAGATFVTDLLPGKAYTLVATYPHGEKTEEISLSFTLPALTTPDILLEKADIGTASIAFTVAEADPDEVGSIEKIELLKGNTVVKTADGTARAFVGLLTNTEYTVRLTYVYDLFDGEGTRTATHSLTVKTNALTTPTLTFTTTDLGETAFTFTAELTDPDGVGSITRIELLQGDEVLAVADGTVRTFDGLLTGVVYTVRFTYTYDLLDGRGVHGRTATRTVKTKVVVAYSVKGNTVTVEGPNEYTPRNLVIPASIAGLPVTVIADEAFRNSAIESLTLPNSVTHIGRSAFNNCEKLTSLVIPDSVTSVGMYAFSSCDRLASVTIGSSLTVLDGFSDCDSLTTITIPSTVKRIAENAFRSSGLTSIVIPSSVTAIGDRAFKYCGSLKTVTIPNSVKSIGDEAFMHCCHSLTSITIPSSVTSIGQYAFYGSDMLTIYTEYTEKPAGWDAHWCSFTIPVVWDCLNNIVASDGYIYTVERGVHYAIKDGVASAIDWAGGYTDAVIAAEVTVRGIAYPVTSIGHSAFMSRAITSVTIPDSVTKIGSHAFYECRKLTSVTIPSSVTSIGSFAFQDCTALTEVYIPSSVTSVDSDIFRYCDALTVYTAHAEKPSGWHYSWNPSKCPVVWNYTEE